VRKAKSSGVDAVVSNSDYVLKAHQQNGYFDSISGHVIYNIADLNPSSTENPSHAKSDALRFGFIGAIEPKKGLEVALVATKSLSNPDWVFRIAGRGLHEYVEDLKGRFTDPRIEWLGFVSANEFYQTIDVAIISSLWPEPLPRTLIESFAFGRSAICARSGGIPEIASLGKKVATYSPHDSKELASIMEEAISQPDEWLAGGFRDEQARRTFSEQSVTRKYRAVYASNSAVTGRGFEPEN
jgi:glycosyltransferase involved in cell wall biosynthesis